MTEYRDVVQHAKDMVAESTRMAEDSTRMAEDSAKQAATCFAKDIAAGRKAVESSRILLRQSRREPVS